MKWKLNPDRRQWALGREGTTNGERREREAAGLGYEVERTGG